MTTYNQDLLGQLLAGARIAAELAETGRLSDQAYAETMGKLVRAGEEITKEVEVNKAPIREVRNG